MKPEDFILLPEGKYGRHDYPDLWIAKRILSVDEDVAAIAPRLRNTVFSQEGYNYDFVGNIDYRKAVQLNRKLNRVTLSLILGKEFLKLLRGGIDGETVYDGKHSKVDIKELRTIYDDMTKVKYDDMTEIKGPWRAEWFDTRFKDRKIIYPVYTAEGWKYIKEELEDCLMGNRRIDIKSWLKDSTSQGLPKPDAKSGKFSERYLFYEYPRQNSVAGFVAFSDGSGLDCAGGPTLADPALGVRGAICVANRDAFALEAEKQRSYTPSEISSALERAGCYEAREKVLKELRR